MHKTMRGGRIKLLHSPNQMDWNTKGLVGWQV